MIIIYKIKKDIYIYIIIILPIYYYFNYLDLKINLLDDRIIILMLFNFKF